ncbi:MAG: DUF1294 domain-containing protein [Bacteroidales bacterium]|nr:DUF1294 domain-containing protein [Bacteroidales bacterium]
MLTKIIIYYFVLINIGNFLLFAIDKHLAKKNKERIPETTMILLSAMGGALGGLCSMYIFRHKTKQAKFYILLPLFLIMHIIIAVLMVF